MPDESTPTDRVQQGLTEITLRNQLGDAGYELYAARTDAMDLAKIAHQQAHAQHTAELAGLARAKAWFLAVSAGTIFGVGLGVMVELFHLAAR